MLWASGFDAEPLVKDDRTRHGGLEVTSGQKFAANIWYYQRSRVKAQEHGCTDMWAMRRLRKFVVADVQHGVINVTRDVAKDE